MLAQFVLFDGFDPLDVIGPFEVFSAAKGFTDLVSVELVAADGPGEVHSGIPAVSLTAAAGLDPDRADLIWASTCWSGRWDQRSHSPWSSCSNTSAAASPGATTGLPR